MSFSFVDRYKARCADLEQELHTAKADLGRLGDLAYRGKEMKALRVLNEKY